MRRIFKKVNKENIPIYIIIIIGAILGFMFGKLCFVTEDNNVVILAAFSVEGALMALFATYFMLQAISQAIEDIKKL